MALYAKITELMGKGVIVSAYALDSYGVAAALSRMAFGNGLGVAIEETVSAEELFTNALAIWWQKFRQTVWRIWMLLIRCSAR